MPTEWHQHFKKLHERVSSSWLRLPAWVRGYGDEMLRYAERPHGRVCDTTDPADVAIRIFAQPSELELISQAVGLLLEQGYLETRPDGLFIANFKQAQENYEAARKREWRSTNKPAPSEIDSDVSQHVSDVPTVRDPLQDKIREDKRSEIPPVVPPSGGQPNPADEKLKRKKPKSALPPSWKPTPEHAEKARSLGLNFELEVEKFRTQADATGRFMVNWNAAFSQWLLKAPDFAPRGRTPAGTAPDDEVKRILRNGLIQDAKAGRYGPKAQAWAESGEKLGELADRLEQAAAKRVLSGVSQQAGAP